MWLFFLNYFKDLLSNAVHKMLIPLRITDRIDENSVMEMETACSFKMLVNSYHSLWNHKQGDYNLNKLLTLKSVCNVFGEIIHRE